MKHRLPVVSIVGRQNTGKSTLFNTLIRERKAIVDSFPGLTRDIIRHQIQHDGVHFIIQDTPGLDLAKVEDLSDSIRQNAMEFLKESDVIILLLEAPEPVPFDHELAALIRKLSLPVIAAVNKIDNSDRTAEVHDFYELGFAEYIPLSAINRFNISLLLDKMLQTLPRKPTRGDEHDISIAIIGRPNAGKSTLTNALLGFQRSIVSDIAGTTRDSVDESFRFQGKTVELIDTAGIRKKSKIKKSVEYFSLERARKSISRADVVIHMIDAQQGITETDKKISDEVMKAGKPVIIAVNKWDLIKADTHTFNEYRKTIEGKFYRASDFPIISISAHEKKRIHRLITMALELNEKASQHIDTAALNRVLGELQSSGRIPQLGGRLKILYATQTGTRPPEFRLFVNSIENFRKDTLRYFQKALQKKLGLEGISLRLKIEDRKDRKEEVI